MAQWLVIGRNEDQEFKVAVVDDPSNSALPYGNHDLDENLVTDGETEIRVEFIDL